MEITFKSLGITLKYNQFISPIVEVFSRKANGYTKANRAVHTYTVGCKILKYFIGKKYQTHVSTYVPSPKKLRYARRVVLFMLWPDISRMARITSDVFRGMI